MLNRWQQRLLAILLIGLTLTCSGCWGRRELETLAIVSGIAFDSAPAGKSGVYVTVQVLRITKAESNTKGSPNEQKGYVNVSASGATVHEALRNCTHTLSRRLFLPHNLIILFGEKLARQGIKEYLDFFWREPESRDTVWVAVTNGKAADMLDASEAVETTPSADIANLIVTRQATSLASGVNMHELGLRYTSKSAAPLTSYLAIKKDNGKNIPKITGTAVFDRDLKMIDKLTNRETRGLLLAINQFYQGVAVVKNPGGEKYASMEILKATSTMTPEIKNGKLQMQVKVRCTSNVSEAMGDTDLMSPEVWESLRRREAAVIDNEIMMAIARSKQLNVDLFGFGDKVYKKYPRAWKQIESDWQEVFNSMEVKVDVNTELQRSGKLISPLIR